MMQTLTDTGFQESPGKYPGKLRGCGGKIEASKHVKNYMDESERCAMQTRLEQTCVVQSTRGWWARGWIAKTLVQREASALCVGGELAVGRVRRGCRPPSFSVKTATCICFLSKPRHVLGHPSEGGMTDAAEDRPLKRFSRQGTCSALSSSGSTCRSGSGFRYVRFRRSMSTSTRTSLEGFLCAHPALTHTCARALTHSDSNKFFFRIRLTVLLLVSVRIRLD